MEHLRDARPRGPRVRDPGIGKSRGSAVRRA